MNSIISSHKVKRTKNTFGLVLYSLYLVCVLSSLKCTVVSRGSSKSLSADTALLLQRLLRRSLKASAASTICTKNNYCFPHHIICTCLWRPEVLLRVVHPGGHPSSVELIPGQSARRNGKESNMLGDFYQSRPQQLSSQDIKLLSLQQMRSHACCSQCSIEGAPAACPPSPLGRGLIQTALRGSDSVSLALM